MIDAGNIKNLNPIFCNFEGLMLTLDPDTEVQVFYEGEQIHPNDDKEDYNKMFINCLRIINDCLQIHLTKEVVLQITPI